jgi:hypothetical protein
MLRARLLIRILNAADDTPHGGRPWDRAVPRTDSRVGGADGRASEFVEILHLPRVSTWHGGCLVVRL